jgi:hypothetical protein
MQTAFMKLRLILALGLVIAALVSCEAIRRQSAANRVTFDEHSVLIPGTAISGDDQEAISKIFKKYDSSLYRVAEYENGTLKKQLGKMSDLQVGAIASEYPSNAKASGLTNWTMKIGSPSHITTVGSPNHVTTAGSPNHVTTAGRPSHVTTISPESDALIKEVTPILEKYSK